MLKESNKEKEKKLVRRKFRSLGPNYVWHLDGHNKLKPFDFLVHGSILMVFQEICYGYWRGYIIKQSTRDHVIILSKTCKKT